MMKKYEPTWDSIKEHPLPKWYCDAKLGIFVHWGLYSVPGWAPTTGELGKVPPDIWFKSNPYAEWYQNSLRIEDSPTWNYHVEHYGSDFEYEDFAEVWKAENWDPNEWVGLFKQVGARYIVFTAKHHDGFNLWPSKYSDFSVKEKGPKRDIIGELTKAARKQDLKMGLYYSGLLDWRFTKEPIRHFDDFRCIYPQTYAYADYAYNQWLELIDKYQPEILWNDIGWPPKGWNNLPYLFAYYYNKIPEGVINDRWRDATSITSLDDLGVDWTDYRTAEYHIGILKLKETAPYKWEFCRGLGYSFGYNRNEGPEHVITPEELVRLLADIVSKNGNLLLNVGPRADGTIPEIQMEHLLTLGKWLDVNGEAIFETQPWLRAEGTTLDGIEVRFTQKEDNLFAILLGTPSGKSLTIESLIADEGTKIQMLGIGKELDWVQNGANLTITIPDKLPDLSALACVFKIVPRPADVQRNPLKNDS